MPRIDQVTRAYSLLASVLLAGCGAVEQELHEKTAGARSTPEDSLVVVSGTGREVWFTLARAGRAPNGTACVERGLEIRAGDKRIPIPLLYTREPPVMLNDSTIRAVLWTNCTPGDAYRVSLESGRPVRDSAGGNQ